MSDHEQHTDLSPEDFQNALKDMGSYIDVTLGDLMQINRMAYKHAMLRKAGKLNVAGIMTSDVVSVTPDSSLKKAAGLLLERRISGLPVVDEQNKVIGIVTEADFLTAIGIPCHHPAHNLWQTLETMFKNQNRTGKTPATVNEIMAHDVVTISSDATVHEVIDKMKQHHVKRIVVTDAQQQLQGIITRSNLVKVLLQQLL